MEQTGFGGSCHWCTEAIFQSLNGVDEVLQGWIASEEPDSNFSEAVLVTYDPEIISLESLTAVHLHSHSCTSKHTMRSIYRSSIYTFNDDQAANGDSDEPEGAILTIQRFARAELLQGFLLHLLVLERFFLFHAKLC
jgi:peptide methionine sulfoxide reductase MsrA